MPCLHVLTAKKTCFRLAKQGIRVKIILKIKPRFVITQKKLHIQKFPQKILIYFFSSSICCQHNSMLNLPLESLQLEPQWNQVRWAHALLHLISPKKKKILRKPWPRRAVKRLPSLLCFLTMRQRAKGTMFEHCLQALQLSCKDIGSSGLKSAANWHCLYSLLQKATHLPQRKKKSNTDVCCIYNNVYSFIF